MKRMCAVILEVNPDSLLVRDEATSQEVFVHTRCACRFQTDDRIVILYNGIMTMSLPPQITASKIFRNC